MDLSEEQQKEMARQYQQDKLKDQRELDEEKNDKSASQPSEKGSDLANDNSPATESQDSKKSESQDTEQDPKKTSGKNIKKGINIVQGISQGSKKDLGLIGVIMMSFVLIFAIFIDILPLVTGGFSSIIDWILDYIFFIALSMATIIATGDIVGSMVGKKMVVNATQTLVELMPVIDLMPFHILAVIIIVLDIKYNILSLSKILKTPEQNIGKKT